MNLRQAAPYALAGVLALALARPGSAACSAGSGQKTAALIELYTSEGCSSCPPAEQTLARLQASARGGSEWYALALHVNYWDYLGWQDPYAQPIFSERHHWLVQANRQRVVYTPHFFVSGAEISGQEAALRAELARVNRNPAGAHIQLDLTEAADGVQQVHASARAAGNGEPLALYVALAENHLVSRVARGENGGATLSHEHVVRSWMGPFPLFDGSAQMQQDLSDADNRRLAHGELVAFVENQQTGQVLQALGLASCKP
jgi:hypothetical protein